MVGAAHRRDRDLRGANSHPPLEISLPTCPTCRHVHAGPDFGWKCIGCYCPHDATCDCGHCETRAILNDHEAMAALEEGMRKAAGGDTIMEFRSTITLTPGDPDAT